jgi:hypothetical protein
VGVYVHVVPPLLEYATTTVRPVDQIARDRADFSGAVHESVRTELRGMPPRAVNVSV